jgi:hypothetical protein
MIEKAVGRPPFLIMRINSNIVANRAVSADISIRIIVDIRGNLES